MTDIYW